jgi:ATP synthase protein I
MADNRRGSDEPDERAPRPAKTSSTDRSAEEAALSARLRGLGEQLGQHRPREPSESRPSRPAADASGYARGFRLSSELVAGVLVGAAIGWAIDRLLHSTPWGMIVFLLLGFAAGVVNVIRAAGAGPENDPDRPSGS